MDSSSLSPLRGAFVLVSLLLSVLCFQQAASAQTPRPALSGRVLDEHHDAVADARVTLRQTATHVDLVTTTDANGHFLLPNMPVSTTGMVTDIPVVVQLGRWRKQLTITTTTTRCSPRCGRERAAT